MMLKTYLFMACGWCICSMIWARLRRSGASIGFSLERGLVWPLSLADLTWLRWVRFRRRRKIRARLNAIKA